MSSGDGLGPYGIGPGPILSPLGSAVYEEVGAQARAPLLGVKAGKDGRLLSLSHGGQTLGRLRIRGQGEVNSVLPVVEGQAILIALGRLGHGGEVPLFPQFL